MKKLFVDPAAMVCPWCSNGALIETCEHNPFALRKRIRELEAEVWSLERFRMLRDALKDALNPDS